MAKLKKGWGWRILGGVLGGLVGTLVGNPLLGAALGYGASSAATGGGYVSDWMKGQTGSGLTTAQVEQNDWNTQQAQEQRSFELEADSTKYQRQVADMQAAGLNPALMYGSSISSAGSVSGQAASGSASPSPSGGLIDTLINLAFAKQRMELLKAEKRNVDTDTELKSSQTILNQHNIPVIDAQLQLLKSQKDLTDSQRSQVDKVVEWFDREKQASIDVAKSQARLMDWEAKVAATRINLLSAQQKRTLQEILNLRQEICESYSRIALNEQNAITSSTQASVNLSTVDEIASRISMLDSMTSKFSAETGLTNKQLNWYWWEHGAMPIVNSAVGVAGMAVSGGFLNPASPVIRGFGAYRP